MDPSLETKTDEELAALTAGKNEAAFGVLLGRYQGRLLRYGRRFLAEDAHIDDAVQETFIKAYENIQSFDVARPFSPWLYRIAHNTFVNELRRKTRNPFIALDLDAVSAHHGYEMDPAGEEERQLVKEQIDRGLSALSPLYREVLVLHYLEDLSYQEIADVLRVPLGTVGVRLKRARESLKRHVERN